MRGLLAESKAAALAGWSGKQVIHPKQVGLGGVFVCVCVGGGGVGCVCRCV